jgi:aryl-alcohol dehydrogenase-like predicted oxidoreductase
LNSLVLGTVQFGLNYGINNHSGKPSYSAVFEILDAAWENGIDTLDTADAYGNAIQLIASYHKATGRIFRINTKFKNIDIAGIKNKLRSDIVLLQCGRINSLFFHSYKEYKESGQGLNELANAKEEGLVVSLGVSVYTNEELDDVLNDPKIDIVQLPYNLLDNHFQRGGILTHASQMNKKIQARSVFLQGLFFVNVNRLPEKLGVLRPWLERVDSIAASAELSKETLCLLYPGSQPYIDEIIIGVDTKEQLLRNLSALRSILPLAVKDKIDEIAVSPSSILYPPNWS